MIEFSGPCLVFYDQSGQATMVDAEDSALTLKPMSTRELEILLSLLGYAANQARKELRRRSNQ